MATVKLSCSESNSFKVRVTNRSFIKASNLSNEPYILPVSNLDLIPGRDPATCIFIYSKPSTGNFESVTALFKTCLPEYLNHFFPFAGRITKNASTSRPEVLCNNEGAELVEAQANVSLFDIDFTDTKKSLEAIILPFASDVPLCVQVIGFTCGGFSLTWCSNHMLVDAYSISRLTSSWSELIRMKRISKSPNFDRSPFLPRSPQRFNSTVDCTYTTCTPGGLVNVLSGALVQRGVYLITASDLDRLQALASRGGRRATRLEAFSAHVWKVLAKVVGESDTACQMGWFVDGRRRMGPAYARAMGSYIGNGHSAVTKEASVKDLRDRELFDVAEMVGNAIKEVANEDHFLDLVNWVEHHDKEFMLHKGNIGLGSPIIFMSSCHHLPVESEFGFGKALLAVLHALGSERLATGFMNWSLSPAGDGSWIVNAVLWPQVMMALQADPTCALKPITAGYLRGLVGGGGGGGGGQGLSSRL